MKKRKKLGGEIRYLEKTKDREPEARREETTLLQDILYLLLKILGIVVALLLIFTFLFGIFPYQDVAMKPSIKDGDLVLFYRLDKNYIATDTIVLEYQGNRQVRRVVAVAGDVVDISDDGLMINGAVQQEAGIYEDTVRYAEGIEFPVTVGKGQVFVLGDSRLTAADSRIYGPVEIKDTLGKVMTLIRRRDI